MYIFEKWKNDKWLTIICCIIIFLGLLARDLFSVSISKYFFLIVVALPIILGNIKWAITFSFFIIPLYVGLPGNYVSILLFARMIYEGVRKQFIISTTGFILSIVVSAYILIQNSITGYLSIYNTMAALDFLLLYLLLSSTLQNKLTKNAILAFSLGNVLLGIIMLGSTLRYFSINDLMNSATRMGNSGILIGKSRASMIITIDPNFYGMNVIASVSSCYLLLSSSTSKKMRFTLLLSIVANIVFCLIGLSRTFVLLLLIWIALYVASQRNIRKTLIFLFSVCILLLSITYLMPTVVNGLFARFEDSDVAGGNGRIYLILKYYEEWFKSALSIIFGIGLFNCHTHCAPLLYLFGLGIAGFIPLLGWFMHVWNFCKQQTERITFKQYIPFVTAFISYATIPAAGSMNYTLPILIAILSITIENKAMPAETENKYIYIREN